MDSILNTNTPSFNYIVPDIGSQTFVINKPSIIKRAVNDSDVSKNSFDEVSKRIQFLRGAENCLKELQTEWDKFVDYFPSSSKNEVIQKSLDIIKNLSEIGLESIVCEFTYDSSVLFSSKKDSKSVYIEWYAETSEDDEEENIEYVAVIHLLKNQISFHGTLERCLFWINENIATKNETIFTNTHREIKKENPDFAEFI